MSSFLRFGLAAVTVCIVAPYVHAAVEDDLRDGDKYFEDGDWKKAKISETDSTKMFSDCDAAYTRALQGLVNSLKSSGTLH